MKEEVKKIVAAAKEGRERAYAPYSKFKVGAAILLKDGTIIRGCNIENASFGLTCCAERNAIFSLITQGYDYHDIVMFAVIADTEKPVSPCGACRQVLAEFLDSKTPIILANLHDDVLETNLAELLPYTFLELENV